MAAHVAASPAARGRDAPWLLAAAALGLGLLALNVVRASTQSVTHDEALTFLWFAAGPLDRIFADFQQNNHVLHSALVWFSARQFGYSELALRLPSLLGGAICLAAAWALCRALLGSRWLFLLGYALLVLNPLLLDFLSAARGYGLALGFLLVALLAVLHLVRAEAGGPGRAAIASVAAALSVASQLSTAPACGALLLVAVCAVVTDRRRARRLATAALLVLPALILGLALLARALPGPGVAQELFGAESLQETAVDLVKRSLAHHHVPWPLDTNGAVFRLEVGALALVAAPLCLVTLALVCATWTRRFHALPPDRRALLVVGGTLVLAAAAWAALHVALGVPWPLDRKGLSFLALGSMCAVALARTAREQAARDGADGVPGKILRAASTATLALLVLVTAQEATQLQRTHYALWRFDAGARDLIDAVRERESHRPLRAPDDSVRLALASWKMEPALSFYRLRTRSSWLAPILREDFDPAQPWDYLVSLPPLPVPAADVRVIHVDPVSGAVLAVPAGAPEFPR
jgi:hypothetical protein